MKENEGSTEGEMSKIHEDYARFKTSWSAKKDVIREQVRVDFNKARSNPSLLHEQSKEAEAVQKAVEKTLA
jgi:hypothetical protein